MRYTRKKRKESKHRATESHQHIIEESKGIRKEQRNMKQSENNKVAITIYSSIITSNVNKFTAPIKTQLGKEAVIFNGILLGDKRE